VTYKQYEIKFVKTGYHVFKGKEQISPKGIGFEFEEDAIRWLKRSK